MKVRSFLYCFNLGIICFPLTTYASTVATPFKTITTINEPSAQLGGGYSTDGDQAVTQICLNHGPVTYSGTNTGIVDLDKLYDLHSVMQQLNIEADLHAQYGMFSTDARADFMHYLENDDLSESLIYRTTLSFKDSNYNIPTIGPLLNSVGQQWLNKPDQFRSVCGDSYVAQMHYGAYLYIVYQLHFLKQEDKKTFDATFKGSFANLANFTASMQQQIDKLNIQGNLHVFALQVGGNPQYLSDIFKSPNPSQPSAISQCSFDNLVACNAITTAIMNYVTTTNPNSFPNQLTLKPGDVVPQTAATTGLETVDYSHIVPITTKSQLTPEIIAARDALGAELTQTQNDLQHAEYLTTALTIPYVYKTYLDNLSLQIANLETNAAIFRDAGLTCFNNLSACLAAKANADQLKITIDRRYLNPPETIAITISNKQGMVNQQLFVATDMNDNPINFSGIEINPSFGEFQSNLSVNINDLKIIMVQRDPNSGTALATFNGGYVGNNQYSGTVTTPNMSEVDTWIGTITKNEDYHAK